LPSAQSSLPGYPDGRPLPDGEDYIPENKTYLSGRPVYKRNKWGAHNVYRRNEPPLPDVDNKFARPSLFPRLAPKPKKIIPSLFILRVSIEQLLLKIDGGRSIVVLLIGVRKSTHSLYICRINPEKYF
jgi:hypothetical protein